MANRLVFIPRTGFGTLLGEAITSRYGNAVVHYTADDRVIFTCPTLSDKVISISRIPQTYSSNYFDKLACMYADSWTSGTTLVNPVSFCGNARTGSAISGAKYMDKATVVLGDTFLIVAIEAWREQMMIVGKLTNGNTVCLGFNDESGYCTETHGYITNGKIGEILIPTISEPFKDGLTHVLLPLIFTVGTTSVVKNGDNSYATISGMYNIPNINGTMGYQGTRMAYSTTFFITKCRHMYNANGQAMLHTPLFCEIEMA